MRFSPTPEQVKFIYSNYKGKYNKELTDLFNKRFGTNYKISQIKAFKQRNKLDSGITGHFKKGQKSWNKERKGIRYSPATEFKKGHKPANRLPIGTERLKRDGYVYVKIQDGKLNKNWKQKHIILWEKHNGPLPKGHVVIFADGDRTNITIENLILVNRSELLTMNRHNLFYDDPELTKTGALIAKVIDTASKVGKSDD